MLEDALLYCMYVATTYNVCYNVTTHPMYRTHTAILHDDCKCRIVTVGSAFQLTLDVQCTLREANCNPGVETPPKK